MSKTSLIILREFITRVRKPSFLVMTLLGPLLIAGGLMLVVYLSLQGEDDQHVLVVDTHGVITSKLRGSDKVSFFVDRAAWDDSTFMASPYTVMALLTDEPTNPTVEFYYKQLPSMTAQRHVANELEKAFELLKLSGEGIDEEAYRRVRKPLTMRWKDITKDGQESLERERAGIGFFFGYFMFIFIFLYGTQVMRGVMEEKQNRVVEVIVSSVTPFQLMLGKIIGIAMVGLTQFLLWILVTSALVIGGSTLLLKDRFDPAALAKGPMTTQMQEQLGQEGMAMPDVNDVKLVQAIGMLDIPAVLAIFLFFFICGYLLYASLMAAIGSAVDTEADTQQFMLPVTLPMIIALVVAQMAVNNPNAPMVVWCSFIPFTAPVVMMVRVVMGSITLWPLLGSMALLVITFLGSTWLAGRIYRTGILLYGKKVTWRELGKWVFYKG
jgi:ABC-2 type transport system permease protein